MLFVNKNYLGLMEPLVMDQDVAKIDPFLEQMEIHLSIMGFPQKPKTRFKKRKKRNREVFARKSYKTWLNCVHGKSSDHYVEELTTINFAYSCLAAYTKIRFTFRLSKQSTVEGLLIQIKEKLKLSYLDAELRLLRIINHVISEIIDPSVKIQNLRDGYQREELRAELIPEEEKNLGRGDYLIRVHHFKKNEDVRSGEPAVSCFANPFLLVMHEGETINQVKIRLGMKLKVDDKELSTWKFLLWELGLDARYLDDTDVASDQFKEKIAFLGPGPEHLERAFVLATFHLGLEHQSKNAL